jgi:N-acetylglucosamine-6-phosphate deacetylase
VVVVTDGWIAPGFIDLQINGAFGRQFTSAEDVRLVRGRLPEFGVTSFLPTLVSAPEEVLVEQIRAVGEATKGDGARVLGVHLEGPFLNPERAGAHEPKFLRLPSVEEMERLLEAGPVRMVTVAPELPGALEVIRLLREREVVVAVGHTMVSYEETVAAVDAGARYATHLFNAMPRLHHRAPGAVGACLGDDRVTVGVIADGEHVHPAVLRIVWRAKGTERTTLVTDAVAALGMPDGRYPLGQMRVVVERGVPRTTSGALAGTTLGMSRAVANMATFAGCAVHDAVAMATAVPARVLGGQLDLGRLLPGYHADVVVLERDMTVRLAMVSGQIVFERRD